MVTSPQLKLIFKGRLEFGSQRTYDMVLRHWQNRIENYFKTDILFKSEVVFNAEELALIIPQQTLMSTEKCWRSTTALLQELAQYAVVGSVGAWCVDNGRLHSAFNIEPVSDKAAVVEYRRGCDLVQQGMQNEASEALSRAIEKYERHALAYERRGYVNYKLKNYNDALYDFNKSIAINPNNPEPFYGRGKVKMVKNDWEAAAQDFDLANKKSIALQPIFWLARMRKGECLYHAKKHADAALELKKFLERNFAETDPNVRFRRRAWFVLGKALLELNDVSGSLEAFNQSLAIHQGVDLAPEVDGLLSRGIARHRAGAPEFAGDLEAAARMGSEEAARLLAEWS